MGQNLRMVGIVVGLACAACGAAQKPAAAPCTLPMKVRLEAGERINLDTQGEPLPTVVRLYQMKDIIRVEESDFAQIWETPEETLGPDLGKVQEFTLFPGQAQMVDVSLAPEIRFVVGVAIFRRPTGTQWRSIVPLPSSESLCGAYAEKGAPEPGLVFKFDNYRVEARSRLLNAGSDHELPTDVAPDSPSSPAKD